MPWIIVYLSTAAVMLPLDFAFLGTIGKQTFNENVGDMIVSTPRLPPAALFYLIYLMGIVVLVNGKAPQAWRHNFINGAVLGLVAYSTFELTNMAMLRHWEWDVVVADILWGTAVTAVAAAGGGLLAGRLRGHIF